MAKIAVRSAVEAYFVKLGAMLLRHGSENGITTSALFRRGGRGGKSDGGSRANAATSPLSGFLWCYMHSSVAMITLLTTSISRSGKPLRARSEIELQAFIPR